MSGGATIRPDWDIRDAILEAGAEAAYACYQCGLCMAVCPWSQVEKVVFPVYRTPLAVKLGALMTSEDPEAIEREVAEAYRCVGCEACAAACPHGVRLPDIVRAIRRVLVEFGSYPSGLRDTVARLQSTGNPFGEPREARAAWAEGLSVTASAESRELLYWPCCVGAYDPRVRRVARAAAEVFSGAGASVGILDEAASCCGEAIRRVGAEDLYKELAESTTCGVRDAGAGRLVVASPHCLIAFRGELGETLPGLTVSHQTLLFAELVAAGHLQPSKPLGKRVVYHDPCTLGRQAGEYEAPREVLRAIPELELVEFEEFTRERSLCCGGGGGGMWLERPKGERLSDIRVRQAVETGAQVLAVACPYCLQMFEDSVKTAGVELEVRDVAELLAASL